jgi:hypothetical protein
MLRFDRIDLQVFYRDLLVAHVPGHPLALP